VPTTPQARRHKSTAAPARGNGFLPFRKKTKQIRPEKQNVKV